MSSPGIGPLGADVDEAHPAWVASTAAALAPAPAVRNTRRLMTIPPSSATTGHVRLLPGRHQMAERIVVRRRSTCTDERDRGPARAHANRLPAWRVRSAPSVATHLRDAEPSWCVSDSSFAHQHY